MLELSDLKITKYMKVILKIGVNKLYEKWVMEI